MSDINKSLVAINTLFDTLLFEEGRLSVVNKNSSLLADESFSQLSKKQRDNLDKAFEIYKSLKPIMTEIASVSLEMESFVIKTLENEMINKETDNLDNMESVLNDSSQQPVMISNSVDEVVVPTIDESMISNDGTLVMPDISVTENNPVEAESVAATENVVPNVESVETPVDTNDTGFVLSPIDAGVVAPAQNSEEPISQDLVATDQQLQAIENVKQEIVNSPDLSEEDKKEALEKYTRVTENAVKAILVTKVQLEKLAASRAQQKLLINGDNLQNVMPTVQNTQEEQTNVSVPSTNDLQSMIEKANALYKEGKTQEAQALFNQVGEMNKQLQAQVVGQDGQVLVKK